MTDQLDELVEISKKDLNNLTKEDMVKLVIPLIDFSKLATPEFQAIQDNTRYSILNYLENFSEKRAKELKKLCIYLDQLNSKLQQILNNDIIPPNYYSMILWFDYIEYQALNIDDFIGNFCSKNFLEKTIAMNLEESASDFIQLFVSVFYKMGLCALKIERQNNISRSSCYCDFHMFTRHYSRILSIPYITYGVVANPSEFTYFSNFFQEGNDIMKYLKQMHQKMNLSIDNWAVTRALSDDSYGLLGFDILKIFYLSRKGKCLINVLGKDLISLWMDEKTYDLAEKIWPLTEREVLAGCISNMDMARKNASCKKKFSIKMDSFDIYADKDRVLLYDKQSGELFNRKFIQSEYNPRNHSDNIVSLLDMSFKHILQKRKEKERLVEELPDIDR